MLCSKPPPSHLWKLRCAGCAHSHAEFFTRDINVYEFEWMKFCSHFLRHMHLRDIYWAKVLAGPKNTAPAQLQSDLLVGRGGSSIPWPCSLCWLPVFFLLLIHYPHSSSLHTSCLSPERNCFPSPQWRTSAKEQNATMLFGFPSNTKEMWQGGLKLCQKSCFLWLNLNANAHCKFRKTLFSFTNHGSYMTKSTLRKFLFKTED